MTIEKSEPAPQQSRVPEVLLSARAALNELQQLLDRIEPADFDPIPFLDLMAAVGNTLHQFDGLARNLGGRLELRSAKDRIRAYLLAHVGEVVDTYQINGVSGIQESPRRIRELRVEEGMQISAGPSEELKSGQYRLDATDADLARAERWRRRIAVRKTAGSIKDRCLLYLRTIFPDVASKEDLAYVARGQEWPRRMRELEEEGWDIISSVDDPTLRQGSYRLGSLERGVRRERQTIKQRTRILARDDFRCRDCGASTLSDRGTRLQIHHLHHVHLGGTNVDENLVTLCSHCHAGRHANDGTTGDDLLDPSQDPWATEHAQ
jgi:hypothetical protein